MVFMLMRDVVALGTGANGFDAEGEVVTQFRQQLDFRLVEGIGFCRVESQRTDDLAPRLSAGTRNWICSRASPPVRRHKAKPGSLRISWMICASPLRMARLVGPWPRSVSAQESPNWAR